MSPATLTVEEAGALLGISRRILVLTARLHQLLGLTDEPQDGSVVGPAAGEV